MQTPKEKAEELVKDLSQIAPLFYEESIDIAKYMVEEILNEHNSYYDLIGEDLARVKYAFWQEVKTELKKL